MNFLLGLQINQLDLNFWYILPELIIGVAGVVVMLVDAFARPTQRWMTGGLSLVGLLAAAASCVWLWVTHVGPNDMAFKKMIVLDEMRLSFTLIFIFVSAMTILISM